MKNEDLTAKAVATLRQLQDDMSRVCARDNAGYAETHVVRDDMTVVVPQRRRAGLTGRLK